jgi:hypothetical protein
MPRDGAGTYNQPVAQVTTNTPISSTGYNTTTADIATALTGSVARDGQAVMTGALNMGSQQIRSLAAATLGSDATTARQVQEGALSLAVSVGGTANAQTITMIVPPLSYATNQRFMYFPGATNTGPATLNVNGLGAKSVFYADGVTPLAGGEIRVGLQTQVVYDGTNFRLEGSRIGGFASANATGLQVLFTGVPSGVQRITVQVFAVSFSGSDSLCIRVGAGSVATSGYANVGTVVLNGANPVAASHTGAFVFGNAGNAAAAQFSGICTLCHFGGNTWTAQGSVMRSDTPQIQSTAGAITLGGTLDRVQINSSGTDTMDSGAIKIFWEY